MSERAERGRENFKPSRATRASLWFAATDPKLAAAAGARETGFYQALGALVMLVGVLAFASTLAAASVVAGHYPIWTRVLVALIVGSLVLCIDRGLMAIAVNVPEFSVQELGRRAKRDRGLRPMLRVMPTTVLRIVVSLGIAYWVTEALLVVIFAPELNDRLLVMRTAIANERTTEITSRYSEPLKAALSSKDEAAKSYGKSAGTLKDLNGLREKELNAASGADQMAKLECEGVTGSFQGGKLTGIPRCGSEAAKHQAEAQAHHNKVKEVIDPQIDRQQKVLKADSDALTEASDTYQKLLDARDKEIETAREKANEVDGLLAKWQALEELLNDASPYGTDTSTHFAGVSLTPLQVKAWGLRLLLVLLDTAPVVLKAQHSLSRNRTFDYAEAALARRFEADSTAEVATGIRQAKSRVRVDAHPILGVEVRGVFRPVGHVFTETRDDGATVSFLVDVDANGDIVIRRLPDNIRPLQGGFNGLNADNHSEKGVSN